jgi:hypothetical protein
MKQAKLSTAGPHTEKGKLACRVNALAHGLTGCTALLLPHESGDEFAQHVADVQRDLRPKGKIENELVGRIAWIIWRQHRLMRYESAAARLRIQNAVGQCAFDTDGTSPSNDDARHLSSLGISFAMDRVIRYESHLTRQLDKVMDRLLTQQQRRRGAGRYRLVVVAVRNENCKTDPARQVELIDADATHGGAIKGQANTSD